MWWWLQKVVDSPSENYKACFSNDQEIYTQSESLKATLDSSKQRSKQCREHQDRWSNQDKMTALQQLNMLKIVALADNCEWL